MIQLKEADIIDRLEKMCDPDKLAGSWIANFDIQEDGDKLKLVDMGTVRGLRACGGLMKP